MSNSKTVVDIHDDTEVSVAIDAQNKVCVTVGRDDEHQVEILMSTVDLMRLMGDLAARLAEHLQQLEHELGRWVRAG